MKKTLKKRRAKRFPLGIVIGVASVALVMVLVLSSPIFDVKKVEVTGNQTIDKNYILTTSGLTMRKNIFTVSPSAIEKDLKENQYIKAVSTKITYPDKVHINVTERHVRGYVEYSNAYLSFDEEGVVISSTTAITDKLPIVIGLDILGFTIGQPLELKNPADFESVATLNNLFEKYGITDIAKLDIQKPNDIHIYIRGLDISVGSIEDMDDKIFRLSYILEHIPAEDRGYVDITNIDKYPVYQFMR